MSSALPRLPEHVFVALNIEGVEGSAGGEQKSPLLRLNLPRQSPVLVGLRRALGARRQPDRGHASRAAVRGDRHVHRLAVPVRAPQPELDAADSGELADRHDDADERLFVGGLIDRKSGSSPQGRKGPGPGSLESDGPDAGRTTATGRPFAGLSFGSLGVGGGGDVGENLNDGHERERDRAPPSLGVEGGPAGDREPIISSRGADLGAGVGAFGAAPEATPGIAVTSGVLPERRSMFRSMSFSAACAVPSLAAARFSSTFFSFSSVFSAFFASCFGVLLEQADRREQGQGDLGVVLRRGLDAGPDRVVGLGRLEASEGERRRRRDELVVEGP
jgi:hypothetical protein